MSRTINKACYYCSVSRKPRACATHTIIGIVDVTHMQRFPFPKNSPVPYASMPSVRTEFRRGLLRDRETNYRHAALVARPRRPFVSIAVQSTDVISTTETRAHGTFRSSRTYPCKTSERISVYRTGESEKRTCDFYLSK